MNKQPEKNNAGMSRREYFKLAGLGLGGLAMGGAVARADDTPADGSGPCGRPSVYTSEGYTYFSGGKDSNGNDVAGLEPIDPSTPLEPDEMRISFMGSAVPPYGKSQMMMSIFVEVGWIEDEYQKKNPNRDQSTTPYKARDQFIFDCGTGCTTNYNAMNVGFKRMNKIFINHLHADHMGDLGHIYCFGPSGDRKSPLFVWGPSASGIRSPRSPRRIYNDGTKAFCQHLREAMRWHSEAFSFQTTAYKSYKPPTREDWGLPCNPRPVSDDPINDAYAMIPIELDWTKYGEEEGDNVAYWNKKTGVKITHFPVIHNRKGSIGYKLKWTNPEDGKTLTMIYTSDTKPETMCLKKAHNGGKGVDVFIHEMALPAEIWAMKVMGLKAPPNNNASFDAAVQQSINVQNSSHSPQGAFGYLLSQLDPRPRLTVATHFPTTDDDVACALESVQKHITDKPIAWSQTYDPEKKNLLWSYDGMVLRLFTSNPNRVEQRRVVISNYTVSPTPQYDYWDTLPPKYSTSTAQLDLTTQIEPTGAPDGKYHFDSDGY